MVNDEKVLALEKFEFVALVQQLVVVVVEIRFELVAEYIERVVDVSTADMLLDVEFVVIVVKIAVAMVEIVAVVQIAVVFLIAVDVAVKLFLVIADDAECFVGNKQLVD